MGLGLVLFVWAVVGLIAALVGGSVAGGIVACLVRNAKNDRRRAITYAALFPVACVAWAAVVFGFQLAVNVGLLHRDPGIGDAWECPLPNGYAMLMVDIPDYGCIYNPKTQSSWGNVSNREDAVDGVRVAQVAGRYILGGADSAVFKDQGNGSVSYYFLLDTATGRQTRFQTLDALRFAAEQHEVKLTLQPIERVYFKYRFTLFDLFVAALLFLPMCAYAWVIIRTILSVRRNPELAPQTAQDNSLNTVLELSGFVFLLLLTCSGCPPSGP